MEKAKVYCKRRFSKKNAVVKLGRYSTRILAGLVWFAVLWALLTNDALPRQYVEYLESKNPSLCIESSANVSAAALREGQLLQVLPSSWNATLSATEYQLVVLSTGVMTEDNRTSYQVLLVRRNSACLNVVEFKGFVVLESLENSTGSGEAEMPTTSVGTGSVDLLSLLYPEKSTSLLSVPVGHFFALALLAVVSAMCGVLAKWMLLPPLLGMILAGFVLRNVPGIDFARHISNTWGSNIRNTALIIVLIRGGLSMDFKQLRRLKLAVLLLAFIPCVMEGAVDGVLATFWLKMPWQFGFTLGYVVASISPSVVVPTTLNLQRQGYGVESGIPTLIVGAASMDVVISISFFGVFLGLAFSEGSLVLDIFRAPIQIGVGLLFGVIFGLILWVFPTKHFKKGSKVRNRFFLAFGLGLFSLFGSTRAFIGGSNLAGSGALGALVMAFVAGQGWKKEEKELVSRAFFIIWQFFEPLLFGLIGAAVDLRFISSSLVGQAVGLILVGLVVRIVLSYVVILGNHFSWLEMCFVSIAWLPKATVQAAIGSLALDIALTMNDSRDIEFGRQILTVAVLAVVMTAPLGALAMSLLGPVLLKKASGTDSQPPETEHKEEAKLEDMAEVGNHTPSINMVVATPSTPADLHQCANAVLAVDPLPSTDTKGVELKDDVIVIREFEIEPRTL